MNRVTGIGGVFIGARDPKALCAWYKDHLGIDASCICVSNDLFDGKLHKCSRSVFATSLKKIPDFPSDYVDVRHTSEGNLRMKLVEFFEKEIVEACRFCNGTFTKTIEAGEQVSDRTIASHSRLVAEASLTLGETINDKT